MADNGNKISKSLNLNPQGSAPANPVDGDLYYDSAIGSFVYYHGGAWASLDSVGSVVTAASLTSANFTPAIVQNSVIKLTGSTIGNIHGLSASFSAKRVIIYNASSVQMVVKYQSVSEATTNNRIITPTAADMNLVAGEVAEFIYDSTQSRWILVSIASNAGAQAAATTTSNGVVTLGNTPGSSSAPVVPAVDTNGDVPISGYLKLTGSNPVTSFAFTNTLTPKNVCKAWAVITTDGSGGVTLRNGFNIDATVTISTSSIRISFLQGVNPFYAVSTTSGSSAVTQFWCDTTNGSSVTIVPLSSAGSAVNPTTTVLTITVIIFGAQ
jgi:hypothetical protein